MKPEFHTPPRDERDGGGRDGEARSASPGPAPWRSSEESNRAAANRTFCMVSPLQNPRDSLIRDKVRPFEAVLDRTGSPSRDLPSPIREKQRPSGVERDARLRRAMAPDEGTGAGREGAVRAAGLNRRRSISSAAALIPGPSPEREKEGVAWPRSACAFPPRGWQRSRRSGEGDMPTPALIRMLLARNKASSY